MKFSIRTRLTLWYASLLAVSLIVFGMILYYSLFKVFTDNIDEQIDSVAGMMVHAVIGPSGRMMVPRNFDFILERFFGIKTSGKFIQILSKEGVVKGKSSSLEGFILHLSERSHQRALKGKSTYAIVDTLGRYPVRVVTKPVFLKERGLVAMIQVGSSLEGMERIYYYIIYVFVIGTFAAVIVASIGGWIIAGKALKPVDKITIMARRIGAESLHERLSIKGPPDEIGRLAATFNEMIGRLEDSFEQIKQFTGDASHELRTPLTVIKGEIEVALRGESKASELKEVLVSALEEIDRMSYIVSNLLDLAKADKEAFTGESEPVLFDRVVSERFELLGRVAADKGVKMELKAGEPLTVIGDKLRLTQLLFNLIDNAIKYTSPGGIVIVSLRGDEGMARLTIIDTGMGISTKDLPHIFDRFYRVDKARTHDEGGAGLGLSICKEIVDSHGGSIDVK
ncbi:MAG: ATP-binding protein, partial [Thermodesulfobacteriota bacterium]